MQKRVIKYTLLCCIGLFWLTVRGQLPVKTSNISLVLPFCASKILADPNHAETELGNIAREYYQGALIALDSFERARIPIRLSIFDTNNDSLTMHRIMQKTSFKESDLIIGPILQGGNKMLTPFCKEKGIFHVSPLMTFSKTRLNDPFWISSNPDLPGYAQILFQYFVSIKKDSANIIVISDKSPMDNNISSGFKQIQVPAGKSVKLRVVDYNATLDIHSYFSATLPNYVVIPSSKEPMVNRLLYQLKDSSAFAEVSCYGFQQWYDFKSVDFDLWQKKNVHIVTPYYVNYDEAEVKQFVLAYRERFLTEPTDAAIKGYDQMLLYGYALQRFGRNFMEKLSETDYKACHTLYRFKKQKEGFYQNTYLNIIRLKDDRPIKVN
jgi:ABC-type branched-subunit amino acid transport system substrate-binding protein